MRIDKHWECKDIQNDTSWIRDLSCDERESSKRIMTYIAENKVSWKDIKIQELFSLPFHGLFKEIRAALMDQAGFIIVKGYPDLHQGFSPEIFKCFLLGFCASLGTPLIQNRNQDLVFDVKSIEGLTLSSKNSRGPYVKDALPMHTDAGAILGMYCLTCADAGGNTLLSSAQAVHNEIQKVRPDLLEVLYQPFYTDRRGNEPEDSLPYDHSPVFAMHGDVLRCQYHQPFYTDAQNKFPDIPRMTNRQVEALQLFDQIALMPKFALEVKLHPGDIIFINNEEILHGRTDFNHADNKSIRHLLRIWLNTPDILHTFPSFLGYS